LVANDSHQAQPTTAIAGRISIFLLGEDCLLGRYWNDYSIRLGALYVFTGLVVSWVRHGIQYHWKAFPSWESFFGAWFIHSVALGLFTMFAAAAIFATQKFFVGSEWKRETEELAFYIVMTVLVGALAVGFMANYQPSGDDEYSSLNATLAVAF
jgi:hypothetical protein